MSELGIRPNKGLGQHFLFERGLVERMVRQAGVTDADTVLEVGPGLGILTSELLRKARRVVAVELDRSLIAHLESAFGDVPGFELVPGNALSLSAGELFAPGEPFDVVANLPYSAGTAILRHLLEQPRKPRRLTVMLQKEVADRLTARPPDMSVLGVATQFFAEPRLAFTVSPEVFIPPPKVESSVVILEVREEPPPPRRAAAVVLQARQRGIPPEAEAGRQLDRRRPSAPQGRHRRLALGVRRRSDPPGRDTFRRRMGGAGEVRATQCRRGVTQDRAQPLEKQGELALEEYYRINGGPPRVGISIPNQVAYKAEIEHLRQMAVDVIRRTQVLQAHRRQWSNDEGLRPHHDALLL